jgi:hypothetical protein
MRSPLLLWVGDRSGRPAQVWRGAIGTRLTAQLA